MGNRTYPKVIVNCDYCGIEKQITKHQYNISKTKIFFCCLDHVHLGMVGDKNPMKSDENKKKISESKIGERNHFFGKSLSLETKRKISQSVSGEKNGFFGRKHTEESKKKISDGKMGQSGYWRGKNRPPETCKKISESNKGRKTWNKGLTWDQISEFPHPSTDREPWNKGDVLPDWVKKKIREGTIRSYEDPEVRKKHQGENHPFWLGGISFEPYSPEFNNRLKLEIRQRDEFTCQVCNKTEDELGQVLSVHHIDYNKKNSSKRNLISLCGSCHGRTNGSTENRVYWQKFFKPIIVFKYFRRREIKLAA